MLKSWLNELERDCWDLKLKVVYIYSQGTARGGMQKSGLIELERDCRDLKPARVVYFIIFISKAQSGRYAKVGVNGVRAGLPGFEACKAGIFISKAQSGAVCTGRG
jgi:hypothetical protein